MNRRQMSVPRQWLVADLRLGDAPWRALGRLPRGSGVLLHGGLPEDQRRRLRQGVLRIARRRGLVVADESRGEAARVHSLAELSEAHLHKVPMLFLSPIFPTRSHPGQAPMSRMRAAALLRLAKVPVIALGGMDAKKFSHVRSLGFSGWAGIDAWDAKRH